MGQVSTKSNLILLFNYCYYFYKGHNNALAFEICHGIAAWWMPCTKTAVMSSLNGYVSQVITNVFLFTATAEKGDKQDRALYYYSANISPL